MRLLVGWILIRTDSSHIVNMEDVRTFLSNSFDINVVTETVCGHLHKTGVVTQGARVVAYVSVGLDEKVEAYR